MKKIYLALIVLCFSCKKKESAPMTFFPQSYLPVFPGSYWKYCNQTGDTIVYTTSENYVLNQYQSGDKSDQKSTPAYVPLWNGTPVYGYYSPKQIDPYLYYKQVPYLSEIKGPLYSYTTRYGCTSISVVNIDTSIVLPSGTYNNVIVVKYYYSNSGSPTPYNILSSYYAKNIGLVMQEGSHDTIKIISYFISR